MAEYDDRSLVLCKAYENKKVMYKIRNSEEMME